MAYFLLQEISASPYDRHKSCHLQMNRRKACPTAIHSHPGNAMMESRKP